MTSDQKNPDGSSGDDQLFLSSELGGGIDAILDALSGDPAGGDASFGPVQFSDPAWYDLAATDVEFTLDDFADDDVYFPQIYFSESADPQPEALVSSLNLSEIADFVPNPSGDLGLPESSSMTPEQSTGSLIGTEVEPVVTWFRRILEAKRTQDPDEETVSLSLRFGDILAASGNRMGALHAYRDILERLREANKASAVEGDVLRRLEVVIGRSELSESVVEDLIAGLLPDNAKMSETQTELSFESIVDRAQNDVADLKPFTVSLRQLDRVRDTPLAKKTVESLDETAIRSGRAALLQLEELDLSAAASAPFHTLIDAVMDTDLSAFSFPIYRGHTHRRRFLDCCVVRSTLGKGHSYSRHVVHVLRTALRSRQGVTVQDVVSATGSFPEDSGALLKKLRRHYRFDDRDVVINSPHFLRTRAATTLAPWEQGESSPSLPSPSLSSLVVTSLGWGGAADVGSRIAQTWNWGYSTALSSHRLVTFGDWAEGFDNRRINDASVEEILQTTNLLRAMPHLPGKVFVLDQPRAAVLALRDQAWLGSDDHPVPIVVLTMNEQRMRWVARHMLTKGGRSSCTTDEVQHRFEELNATQIELVTAALDRRSRSTPVLIRACDDHLHDGYAEKAGNDPVDDDFDCFMTTADRIRTELEGLRSEFPRLDARLSMNPRHGGGAP